MPHTVLFQDLINQLITEMSISICDQCSWGAEPCKYVAAKELSYHIGIISACRYYLYPIRDVVHCKKDLQVTE